MMNDLEQAIKNALKSENNDVVNKAYLEFIKANFIVPIDKFSQPEQPEVLFLEDNDSLFLPVFSSNDFLDQWAIEIADRINVLNLSGVNLLKGIGENVIICLNIGSDLYKEFNSAEISRMKGMVLKLFKE